MIQKLADNVWKLNVDSNVYLLRLDVWTVIDLGPAAYSAEVERELSKVVALEKVERAILTHFHFDHIGNFSLFPNAKFYASPEEIAFFRENPSAAVIDKRLASRFNVELHPLERLEGFDILKTPGHSRGAICLFYRKEKILFSGDTLFFNGMGRLDLPSSEPEKMDASLEKLGKIPYKILAPGHDY